MPGDVLHANVGVINYIRSEYAFNDARTRGRWQVLKGLLTRRNPYLLCFRRAIGDLQQTQVVHRGLLDIPVRDIVGSTGREKEFTRRFYPLGSTQRQKERWRTSFTTTLLGIGYAPIEVYKVGGIYFVINGHHRVSVARYLNWKTIQAHVSEVPLSVGVEDSPDASSPCLQSPGNDSATGP
jgi:hypothetical protein